jgi:large subunit ribosomal protein L9
MKVILNDYVEHLGERGESVVVKPGYARNYLLPQGLAYLDTPGNRRRFEQEQQHWEEMDLKRRGAAEQLAHGLEGIELLFERRAGENDVLFGSVSTADIAKALVERGIEIDKRRVHLDAPIKELGSFASMVHVHREIKVEIPVHVVRPGEQLQKPDEETATESTDAEAAADVDASTTTSVEE